MEIDKMNLVQKLACIRKMAAVVKKSADGYNYKYPPEDAVLANVTAGMDKYHVSLHVEVDPRYEVVPFSYKQYKKDKAGNVTETEVNEWLFKGNLHYTWKNDDNPDETITANWPLVGQQSDASQAFGSATTYCQRYFLLKYFQTATTKDDPDNYRDKQKDAAEREGKEAARAIIDAMHMAITEFTEGYADARSELGNIIKKHVRVKGKPSGDYFSVTDQTVAAELQKEVLDFIEAYKKRKETK